MRRETQNILLLLVGGALLKITINGTYLRYVKPTVKPWIMAAGLIMVVLAVIAIVRDLAVARRNIGISRTREHADSHDHVHGAARSAWLLVVPVLSIFLIAPPALGADSVLRSVGQPVIAPAITQQGAAAFPALPAGIVSLSLSEFITRSVWDSTDSLRDRTIRLTGFVVQDHNAIYLARLVITCCAADATPMKVQLDGSQTVGLVDDQWIEITGMLVSGSATQANEYIPTVVVKTVTLIPAPADPYEY